MGKDKTSEEGLFQQFLDQRITLVNFLGEDIESNILNLSVEPLTVANLNQGMQYNWKVPLRKVLSHYGWGEAATPMEVFGILMEKHKDHYVVDGRLNPDEERIFVQPITREGAYK